MSSTIREVVEHDAIYRDALEKKIMRMIELLWFKFDGKYSFQYLFEKVVAQMVFCSERRRL